MSQTEATRQSDFVQGARAGQVSVLSVTTTVGSQDLRLCGQLSNSMSSYAANSLGLAGHFVDLQANGGDVYYILGSSAAAVTGANAPNPSAVGVNVTGGCKRIPAGTPVSIKLEKNLDNFIGFICASGTASLVIHQSSPR